MLTSTDVRLITGRLAGKRVTVTTLTGRTYTGTIGERWSSYFYLKGALNVGRTIGYANVAAIEELAPELTEAQVDAWLRDRGQVRVSRALIEVPAADVEAVLADLLRWARSAMSVDPTFDDEAEVIHNSGVEVTQILAKLPDGLKAQLSPRP